jgi:hypothetical protein
VEIVLWVTAHNLVRDLGRLFAETDDITRRSDMRYSFLSSYLYLRGCFTAIIAYLVLSVNIQFLHTSYTECLVVTKSAVWGSLEAAALCGEEL